MVLLLLGLQIVSQVLVNIQWYQIAKFAGTGISFGGMFYINCHGAVVDSITPGVKIGGEITRAVQIKRMGKCSGEQAAAVVALQKMFSLGAFFFVNLFTVGYFVGGVALLQASHTLFFVYGILLLFLLMFAGIFIAPRRTKAYLQARENPHFSWMRRVRGFLLALLDQAVLIRKNRKAWIMLALLSLLIWLLYPAKMYLLAVQIVPDAHAGYMGAITFASYTVAMLPIFPGGLGGLEGTMSSLLLAIGFAISDAVVVTVLFRFVTFWFVMLFSLGFIAAHKTIRMLAGLQKRC